MLARPAASVLASIICLAPLAAGQAPAQTPAQTPATSAQQFAAAGYSAPRTSSGQPSLEGIWTQNFVLLMEASPQAPMLTLPEPAAKAMAASVAGVISTQSDRGLDPEVPELMKSTDGLAIVRGERRTRSVVEPADGKLPYTPEARKESSRGPVSRLYDNHEERPNWERCVTSLACRLSPASRPPA